MLKKIVVIGPESTGKSTLCAQLAEHYNTGWAREYAREYLLTNGKEYTYEDLLEVAKGQVAEEESVLGLRAAEKSDRKPGSAFTPRPIFIDTDMYVMKVWCEFVFGKCHHWILNRIVERRYDLYLLCGTDQPWVKDELREYPDLRTREILYRHYKDCMVNQNTPWTEIRGDYETRLRLAIDAVDRL
jgi:NadR type nicotinamide-nucleotide adenylyltransferase